MRAGVLWALTLVGAAACHDTPTGPGTVVLQVQADKAEYSLASDNGATALLVNLGPATVYAPMNEYVYVEKLEAGQWRDRHPWFFVDGVGVSFAVGAGDSLGGPQMSFDYVSRQPGTYRFVFEVAFDSVGRRIVPEAQRVSAPFALNP
jgi:hypothetical protein